MSNGYFAIQGYQTGTEAAGRANLGPFAVPFGTITNIQELALTAGGSPYTIPVPAGTKGVAVIPPIGSPPAGVTLKWKTVLGDSGDFISTQQPSIMEWDTVNSHVPANLYLVASGNITVTVFFL
jgi:hypothetical protein